jgi:hypothetical protein
MSRVLAVSRVLAAVLIASGLLVALLPFTRDDALETKECTSPIRLAFHRGPPRPTDAELQPLLDDLVNVANGARPQPRVAGQERVYRWFDWLDREGWCVEGARARMLWAAALAIAGIGLGALAWALRRRGASKGAE